MGIRAPDISANISIGADDPTFQAPSIMGGVDFAGDDLPVLGQAQPIPWTVQSGGLPQPAMPSFQGDSPQPLDRAGGIGKALGDASLAVRAAHGAIGVLGGAGKMAGLLPGGSGALDGLPNVTNAITAPLDFGAGTAKDIGNGANAGEAVLGNGLREGLVQATGLASGGLAGLAAGAFTDGAGAPFAARAGQAGGQALARWLLPDGAAIGHGLVQVLRNPPDPKIFPVF